MHWRAATHLGPCCALHTPRSWAVPGASSGLHQLQFVQLIVTLYLNSAVCLIGNLLTQLHAGQVEQHTRECTSLPPCCDGRGAWLPCPWLAPCPLECSEVAKLDQSRCYAPFKAAVKSNGSPYRTGLTRGAIVLSCMETMMMHQVWERLALPGNLVTPVVRHFGGCGNSDTVSAICTKHHVLHLAMSVYWSVKHDVV